MGDAEGGGEGRGRGGGVLVDGRGDAALDERVQEAGPDDAGDGGAFEGVEARAHAQADLREDGAGAGAGEEHAGAEEGAAEEVSVVGGEEADGGEGAGVGGEEVELAGEGDEDAGGWLVGGL